MRYSLYSLLMLSIVITTASCSQNPQSSKPMDLAEKPEDTLHIDKYHGYEHTDALQFLEQKDNDGKPSPKTQAIIDRYNESSSQFFDKHQNELDTIYQEIMSRRTKNNGSVSYNSRGLTFTSEKHDGERFPVLFYGKAGSADKKILIDQSERAKGASDYKLYRKELSPNNEYFSWIEDINGGTFSTLYITPLGDPDNIIHKIKGVGTSLVWDNESKRVYYIKIDEKDRRYFQIRMFNIETKVDTEIYTENDDRYFTFVYRSASNEGVFIFNTNWSASEARYIDFNTSYVQSEIVLSRDNEFTFGLNRFEDTYVISYQSDKQQSKIASFTKPLSPISSWATLYSTKGKFVEYKTTSKYFAFVERSEGADQVKYLDVSTGKIHNVDVTSQRYGANFKSGNHDVENHILRMEYNSDLSMQTIIDVDLEKNSTTTLYAPSIPNFNPDNYDVEFKYIPSHDGVMVPATIIKHKETKLPAPVYQYVYGSYGYGLSPGLPWFALSLIDRGYVHVIAHVRGGDELGKQWHEGGKLLNRKNSFEDFQAVSKYLVQEKYTTIGDISISGESAAGHILGVAVNDSPGLYKSVTALVPAFDIFNKLLNPSLVVTKSSWSEFGNPIESKEAYEYIKSYAPLENIRLQDYPHYFITGRLDDRNVDFFEPLKWAVKVEQYDTHPSLHLVSIEEGGHIRTGYGGKEYDFARQMLFILKAHEVTND